MKVILVLVVFVCCLCIGLLIKNYLIKREKFFVNLIIFLENLLNNISFNNEKLNIILENINIDIFEKDFKELIFLYLKLLKNEIDLKTFKNSFGDKFYYLSDFERNRLLQFLYNLGSQNTEEELKKIKIYISETLKVKEESINKNKKCSNLYLKLFISLGLILFIIFI